MPANDSILHITDIHFWEVVCNPFKLMNKRFLGNANVIYKRRHEFQQEQADAFADVALETGIKTVLLGGDFTSTATEGEFERAARWVQRMSDHGLDIHLVPGNHDVYTFESVRKKRFEQYLGPWMPREAYPCRATLPGGTPLILVPTVCPNYIASSGIITDDEAAQTRALLKAMPEGQPVIVMGHYPVLHKTYSYDSTPNRQLHNADALRKALGESGRKILYLAGHVHRFSYVQDPDYPKLQHATTNAFFLQRHGETERGGFSEIQCGGEGFEIFAHRCGAGWEREVLALR